VPNESTSPTNAGNKRLVYVDDGTTPFTTDSDSTNASTLDDTLAAILTFIPCGDTLEPMKR
jgi:hypothetical protein